MPAFSAFTPLGLLAFSGAPSKGEKIYRALRANAGGTTVYAATGHHDAKLYAQAMTFARAHATAARMGLQARPTKATDLLPILEEDYRVAVPADATLSERRAAVAARARLSRGAARQHVESALTALLGADFTALLTNATPDLFPADPEASVIGLWAKPTVERKLVRLTSSVAILGSPVVCTYEDVTGESPTIHVGEKLIVQPENVALAERVTVTAAGAGTFTATFTKSHDVGSLASTSPWPLWVSSIRHALVHVASAASSNAETRRKINDLMSRAARVVSTWSIVGSLGPFTLDESTLDNTPTEI